MNYENQYTQKPEYFEDVETIDDLIGQYNSLAGGIVTAHDARFSTIIESHQESFAAESRNPGTHDIGAVLQSTYEGVHRAAEPTLGFTHDVIKAAGDKASALLSDADSRVLAHAKEQAERYGVGSYIAEDTIRQASSKSARRAIEICLDANTFRSYQENAERYGIDSYLADDVLKQASNKNVRAAMKASLDAGVLASAEESAGRYGIDSFIAKEALGQASNKNVRAAMRASLDGAVLNVANDAARRYGIDSFIAKDALDGASSKNVRQVFERWLKKSHNEGVSEEEFLRNMHRNRNFNERRNTSNGSGHADQGRRHYEAPRQEPPRQEAPKRPKHDVEVEQIVAQVAGGDGRFGWLRSENPNDIRRVINTVRAIRAKAEAGGEDVSDRDIYLRYRRGIDKGEINGKNIADPQIVKSYEIIDAMMGGNIRGKLPF